eukprot:scaffold208534_cov30-Tisochrysis_lutea.AAC.4
MERSKRQKPPTARGSGLIKGWCGADDSIDCVADRHKIRLVEPKQLGIRGGLQRSACSEHEAEERGALSEREGQSN